MVECGGLVCDGDGDGGMFGELRSSVKAVVMVTVTVRSSVKAVVRRSILDSSLSVRWHNSPAGQESCLAFHWFVCLFFHSLFFFF